MPVSIRIDKQRNDKKILNILTLKTKLDLQ